MTIANHDILAKLQTDILRLQGFRPERSNPGVDAGLGPIIQSFPNATFPTGCVHEFLTETKERSAVSHAFIAGLSGTLMKNQGVAVWISASRMVFPPALVNFGIQPDRFIFIDLKHERDVLWAMDEALKCAALSVVVGELNDLSFTASRRLQLAVEQSQVTGFIVRKELKKLQSSAAVSRWRITSLPSEPIQNLPGIGFPKWRVELLRVRNGKAGEWEVCWRDSAFRIENFTEAPHRISEHRLLG